jgi:hypothetical protein
MYGSFYLYQSLFTVDSEARRQSRDARDAVEELREQVDRISLFTAAIWSLANEKLGISEDQLRQRVQDIDLSDGKLDGKVAQNVGECPKCKRTLSRRNRSCIYCGYKLQDSFPG